MREPVLFVIGGLLVMLLLTICLAVEYHAVTGDWF